MALIDFHCHLDLYPDPHSAVAEAVDAGAYVLSVTTTPSAFAGTRALAPVGGRIRTALGLHPELAVVRRHELGLFRALVKETAYIGEVGLDGSPPHRDGLSVQCEVLSEILDVCARAGGKTLSLHSRGAADLLLDLLETEPGAGRFVLHWFSATPKLVARAAELGCWFSVGEAMARSRTGRAAIEAMPFDRVLPETDGPFGSVAGRPASPADAKRTYATLGEVLNRDAEQVEKSLTANFRNIVAATSSVGQ